MTSAPVYLFRVVVPTRDQFVDFYTSQLAAALDAERRFPNSPPAQTTCLSR